jgi:ATP-binding cassette subfamily F protein 3
MIVVSHDRFFLDRVIDRLLVIEDGRHTLYRGNYSYYVQTVEQARQADKEAPAQKPQARRPRPSRQRPRNRKRESSPYDGLSLAELEERVIAKEEQIAAIQGRFADQAVYRDPQAAPDLQAQLQAATEELAALNAAWEQRAQDQSS